MSSPHVIPHNPADHRYVSIPEVSDHVWFSRCMSTGFPSSISDFVGRDGPNFLKSTSKWTEQHLINRIQMPFLRESSRRPSYSPPVCPTRRRHHSTMGEKRIIGYGRR